MIDPDSKDEWGAESDMECGISPGLSLSELLVSADRQLPNGVAEMLIVRTLVTCDDY